MREEDGRKKDKRRQINCRVRPDIYERVEERAKMRGTARLCLTLWT